MKRFITILIIAVSVSACSDKLLKVDENHSFENALSKARAIHAKTDAVVTIRVSPGVFRITRPIEFTHEDSHLRIIGSGAGKSVITGTLEAPEWEVGDDGIWVANLNSIMPSGGSVPQLYVGGKRAVCARTPNGIDLLPTPKLVKSIVGNRAVSADHKPGASVDGLILDENISPIFNKVNIAAASGRLRINYLHAWDITRRILWCADSTSIYHISGQISKVNPTDVCSQVFFDNDKAFLDAPGEYFFDSNQKLLYYIPIEGQDPLRDKAQIPCTSRIFQIKGSENNPVIDISFEDLTICGTRFDSPWTGNAPQQGAASSDAAVMANFAHNLHFTDCEITLTANNGIWLRKACFDCSVERCHLHELGIGGVKIGDLVKPKNEETLLTRNIGSPAKFRV